MPPKRKGRFATHGGPDNSTQTSSKETRFARSILDAVRILIAQSLFVVLPAYLITGATDVAWRMFCISAYTFAINMVTWLAYRTSKWPEHILTTILYLALITFGGWPAALVCQGYFGAGSRSYLPGFLGWVNIALCAVAGEVILVRYAEDDDTLAGTSKRHTCDVLTEWIKIQSCQPVTWWFNRWVWGYIVRMI
ncbi:hypothetical protein CLAFUW4_01470 [Fulvia fulva]|uniref:Uncharacterized protein n=1 Tax=Passalora fulva TaxID=5499 RepID=A0A9Q8L745_PASFU|nr:uncharacterized protein CLAFUR5_01472 [Fulvia fulva]KAK4636145.1 hypothetical protein CLAFUR4_01471 [Fulvia fulva]KAK4637319.1 hypothetical protein CLAFUR0_01472 [Fulvia fulva]UJO12040.1 hypothetical protein CLAFUR5_01472 [Fulvia fulva]WPV08181.1 hypothetical protein CLAFUW4_01470 [Fulvia fulva]WPV25160.1 hypothetical protein CLAFUW7_01475 [Fulvia fulva]